MIVKTNLLIKEIKDGKIFGEDITDESLYECKFFTDLDSSKFSKFDNKKFKSKEVDQETLSQMLKLVNNFNGRKEKVEDKVEEELKKNEFLKTVKKIISRMEEEKEYIYEDDEDIKVRNEKISDFIGYKKIDKNNFEEVYKKLKELDEKSTKEIIEKVNKSYDIGVNSPVVFTGNLTKDGKTILSKNAYVDPEGKLTKRVGFYSASVRGDFFEQDLILALTIKRIKEDFYIYQTKGKYLTPNKIFNIIKRTLNSIEKTGKSLFIRFEKYGKETVEEIEEYSKVLTEYMDKNKETKDREKNWSEYKDKIVKILETIKGKIAEDSDYGKKIAKNYNINIPILNNYELFKSINEVVENELTMFKNINKKFLDEIVEIRKKTTNKEIGKIKEDLESHIKYLLSEKIKEKGIFGTYFMISGRKDKNNEGYGFITEVPNASKKVKNFLGFFVNTKIMKNIKEEIFEYLSMIKKTLEKK